MTSNFGPFGVTVSGTYGADTLQGSDTSSRIWGGLGYDLIFGGAASDHILDELGSDTVYGGDGDDIIGADLDPTRPI